MFFVNGQRPILHTAKFLQFKQESAPFLSRLLETQLFASFLDKHVECPGFLDVSACSSMHCWPV